MADNRRNHRPAAQRSAVASNRTIQSTTVPKYRRKTSTICRILSNRWYRMVTTKAETAMRRMTQPAAMLKWRTASNNRRLSRCQTWCRDQLKLRQ